MTQAAQVMPVMGMVIEVISFGVLPVAVDFSEVVIVTCLPIRKVRLVRSISRQIVLLGRPR
jgi:hypothetical protein